MKNSTTTLLASACACAAIALSSGCYDISNTSRSRQSATSLATRMSTYRDRQSERIKKLNEEYREAFAKLMDTLEDLSQAELQQGRDGDAQGIADTLIADNDASLRGNLRGAFGDAVRAQRKRMADADTAVATVRDNYTQSYKEVKLEIAKIDKAIKNLQAMSAQPSDVKEIEEAIKVIQAIATTYREAQEKAATQSSTSTGGSAGANP